MTKLVLKYITITNNAVFIQSLPSERSIIVLNIEAEIDEFPPTKITTSIY